MDGEDGITAIKVFRICNSIFPRQIFPRIVPCFVQRTTEEQSRFCFISFREWAGYSILFRSFFFSNLFSSEMLLEIQFSWNKYHLPDAKGTKSWIDAIF